MGSTWSSHDVSHYSEVANCEHEAVDEHPLNEKSITETADIGNLYKSILGNNSHSYCQLPVESSIDENFELQPKVSGPSSTNQSFVLSVVDTFLYLSKDFGSNVWPNFSIMNVRNSFEKKPNESYLKTNYTILDNDNQFASTSAIVSEECKNDDSEKTPPTTNCGNEILSSNSLEAHNIRSLLKLGFDINSVKIALNMSQGDVGKAKELLIASLMDSTVLINQS